MQMRGRDICMRILLDTNIIIHREATCTVNDDIGILFRWIDNLHYSKYIHPITVEEINKLKDNKQLKTMNVKLENYNVLKTLSPISAAVENVSAKIDKSNDDLNDTKLLNELYNDRVDILVTEDKKIRIKASMLGISDRVFTIELFLDKVTKENPSLVDYKVLSIKKEYFGNVDLEDEFFDSFKEDYPGFEKWFVKKSEAIAYICRSEEKIMAFLYVKVENEEESYIDINPIFKPKKRLKIGTFKVTLNGYKLGERFLKIIFDNALQCNVDEIYVTIFDKRIEQQRLISLFEEYGFKIHGEKGNQAEIEFVYTRDFTKKVDINAPKLTYPYISKNANVFIVPIYPAYHTDLFPDSILKTELPSDFIENEPHRNAIKKVYISRSYERNLRSGDIIIFYRTGGYYQGVITTIGVVENICTDISDSNEFIRLCGKRSVFTERQLLEHWNYSKYNKPFIVNFLYIYSFNKRVNLKRLIELNVISDVNSAPRGYTLISKKNFEDIIKEVDIDEGIIVD